MDQFGLLGIWAAVAAGAISSLVTAIAMLVLMRRPAVRHGQPGAALSEQRDEDVVFLFNGGTLIDATPAARNQLPRDPAHADDLARLVIAFCQRFEGLAERLEGFATGDRFEIAEMPDDPDSLRLIAENRAGHIRIAVTDPLRDSRSEMVAHYSLAALRAELFTLRSIAERSPIPTWKRRNDGTIIWANGTYMSLASSIAGAESLIGWPPPDVFSHVASVPADAEASVPQQRVSVAVEHGRRGALWFDLIALPGEIETLYFALPIDKLVRAENALTEFMQTLTKTFAHLRIGLAIFDQKRRLALFNPALVDLTGLPAEHLSARPTLHAFLDALRDAQKIPEPKDYKSWRMQIAQLEAGAADGTFEETWYLSNGQTFRVSGRPHPDGAVAYLFEDISSEVSMTRTYRSEIELSQSVVDTLEMPIAAFSPTGTLTLANRAYAALWDLPHSAFATETGITAATGHWEARSKPGPDWAAIRARVLRASDRMGWSEPLELLDGTPLVCDVRRIAGGATMVTFSRGAAQVAPRTIDEATDVSAEPGVGATQSGKACPEDAPNPPRRRAIAS
ncbi:diguanylate cyclase [Meridianimarinicoccus roseus]|uniref:Diguanylate cyclase n=1 Tax=Meridianimarinicoccus roseus TaxID=2072018 RepID=A0A2V2LA62_9RHOB|nr:PAS-domain containing protein [Meridianimarinicoccus roseus]PWR02145.1 diguanylate cyclase [Meridianimarinicoccus roseus]